METALATTQPNPPQKQLAQPSNFGIDIYTLGQIFAASGYFKDSHDEAQAIVKIVVGSEMGISPAASMMGIHIIEGKPSIGANLIASKIKSSGKYDYRVVQWDNEQCVLEFFEKGNSVGQSSFTLAEARAAGLAQKNNWKFYAKPMCFSRALSQGARVYCPDVFSMPVYSPDELGADVDAEGNVIQSSLPTYNAKPRPAKAAAKEYPVYFNGEASAQDTDVLRAALANIKQAGYAKGEHPQHRDIASELATRAESMKKENAAMDVEMDAAIDEKNNAPADEPKKSAVQRVRDAAAIDKDPEGSKVFEKDELPAHVQNIYTAADDAGFTAEQVDSDEMLKIIWGYVSTKKTDCTDPLSGISSGNAIKIIAGFRNGELAQLLAPLAEVVA